MSLIELIMFIVIVGIAVVSILQVLGMGARSSPDPMRRKQALAIAEGMMEEVRLAHYTFCDGSDWSAELPETQTPADCKVQAEGPGAEAGNTRPFDNVNDYVGNYTKDAAGNDFPAGYAAVVAVVAETAFGPPGALVPSSEVLHITVTVTYAGGGDAVVLDGYRTRYAPRSL